MTDTAEQNNPPTLSFPCKIDIPITFKIEVDSDEEYQYYKANDNIDMIADLFDMFSDFERPIVSINGLTIEDVRKKLQAST